MSENPLVLFESEAKIGHLLDAYVSRFLRARRDLHRP
jgi:hypothetical protein